MNKKIQLLLFISLIILIISGGSYYLIKLTKKSVWWSVGESVEEKTIRVPIKQTNITLERIHPEKVFGGEIIEITLIITNQGDEEVELSVSEAHRPGIDYIDPIEITERRLGALTVPYYRWKFSLAPKESKEIKYHIKSDHLGLIGLGLTTAADQYGNHFESEPSMIKVVCDPNGQCDPGESYAYCPEDCETGRADDRCDGIEDGRCDPDCTISGDKDCAGLPDRDQDSFTDAKDNCPDVYNPDQIDADGDGVGNACDR